MTGLPELNSFSEEEAREILQREAIYLWLISRNPCWKKSPSNGFEMRGLKDNEYIGKIWYHKGWIASPHNAKPEVFATLESAALFLENLNK